VHSIRRVDALDRVGGSVGCRMEDVAQRMGQFGLERFLCVYRD
jgi:hypothetical protein